MSPASAPRQLLVWSVPTVAVLLSFLWYKRKKTSVRCDQEGIDPSTSTRSSEPITEVHAASPVRTVSEEIHVTTPSPSKPISYARSLSGSAPIDIKSARSNPVVISDTELDLEIEKIKSMKAGMSVRKQTTSPVKRRSPKSTARSNGSSVDEERHCSIDRDSANHSPEVMMATSPTLSNVSDNPSDSDSGKGGSDVATPPPVTQEPEASVSTTDVTLYEFVIAQTLVGRLIGRHGTFVHHIREKTNARILIKRHPDSASKLKVCAIEGTTAEIEAALEMIREKFPIKRYPELCLERVSFVPIVPDCMHLRLIEGVNNDTIMSCVVTPAHLFLQQSTHPTYPSLNILSGYMDACYTADSMSGQAPPPPLPAPVLPGTICAAQSTGSWYRASVISADDDAATACVQFLDYGGFATIAYESLRQIRGDFLLLPFQAAECLLANVEPVDAESGWSQEAFDTVVELTTGVVVFTQIVDYSDDGVIPLVHIYIRKSGQQVMLLNRELANRGLAVWKDDITIATR